MTLIQL